MENTKYAIRPKALKVPIYDRDSVIYEFLGISTVEIVVRGQHYYVLPEMCEQAIAEIEREPRIPASTIDVEFPRTLTLEAFTTFHDGVDAYKNYQMMLKCFGIKTVVAISHARETKLVLLSEINNFAKSNKKSYPISVKVDTMHFEKFRCSLPIVVRLMALADFKETSTRS